MLLIILICIPLWIAICSRKAYCAFAQDKQLAIEKAQRTPEATLLHLARIGGWPGAKYAQQKLRHKSYKQPFGQQLNRIGLEHGAIALTVVLTFGALAVLPAKASVTSQQPAATTAPPAPGQLAVSLRPPAGRP